MFSWGLLAVSGVSGEGLDPGLKWSEVVDRQRFYLARTVHLLKRLLCLVPFALAVTGCDVATNQTGGAWLSSQQGIRPPTKVVIEDIAVPFKGSSQDSSKGWLQEATLSPAFQVGSWKGSSASSFFWIPLDSSSAVGIARGTAWDSLRLNLSLSTPRRGENVRVARQFWVTDSSRDSADLVAFFGGSRTPVLPSVVFYQDTLSIAPSDSLRQDALPAVLRDTLSKLRSANPHKAGLLVRLLPVAGNADGIVQVSAVSMTAKLGADTTSSTYYRGSVSSSTASRGLLTPAALDPNQPLLQGGPVSWSLRLFPDTAVIRAAIAKELSARGYSSALGAVAVMDAELSFDSDSSRTDTTGERIRVYSSANGSPDLSRWLAIDSTQAFDTVKVTVDTFSTGDSLELHLVTTGSATRDSLVLAAPDTLPVAHSFGGIRWIFQRSGLRVRAIAKGLAGSIVEESQKNRANEFNAGALLGKGQRLATRRAFSMLVNWTDRQSELLLVPYSDDSNQWWQMRPKLGTAKLRLTVLPLGVAK